jgi:SEC-C motif
MDLFDKTTGLGDHLRDELPNSKLCLEELRKIQKEISKRHETPYEIFDLGLDIGFESEKTIEGKLDRLIRACIWHAIALKTELNLKLLYTIDGYLSGVDLKNPVSTFLLARYLLELAATVSAIDFGLDECVDIDLRDWNRRGTTFLTLLYRARHSTSDARFKQIFNETGISPEFLRPFRIGKAIAGLTSRPGFKSAVSMYDELSNICHHNGSGHKWLTQSFQETNVIVAPGGRPFFLKEKALAVTMGYPASGFELVSLARTGRVAWWSAHSTSKMISEMREAPFTDKELSALSKGRLTSVGSVFYGSTEPQRGESKRSKTAKVGRNDPCPCGSGKKYKVCCFRKIRSHNP